MSDIITVILCTMSDIDNRENNARCTVKQRIMTDKLKA